MGVLSTCTDPVMKPKKVASTIVFSLILCDTVSSQLIKRLAKRLKVVEGNYRNLKRKVIAEANLQFEVTQSKLKETSAKLEAANSRIEAIERELRDYKSPDTPVTQASIKIAPGSDDYIDRKIDTKLAGVVSFLQKAIRAEVNNIKPAILRNSKDVSELAQDVGHIDEYLASQPGRDAKIDEKLSNIIIDLNENLTEKMDQPDQRIRENAK